MSKLPYLNLGCGQTFHSDWTNIDFVSNSEYIMAHNLLKGIPFPDNQFEVVYHSHVLEHIPKEKAIDFIRECYRVLKPDGIIRIAIPDLEQIALNYVKYLNESLQGVPGAEQKYDWTMLELFDQMVRSKSGGGMMDYIKDNSLNNDAFLLMRNGYEVKQIMEVCRANAPYFTKRNYFPTLNRFKLLAKLIKRKLISALLGKDSEAYLMGKFRLEGEIHQWMYDRYSLKRILENCGFKKAQVKIKFESEIPNWKNFNLDGKEGILRKPDSLFMEAVK